VATDAARALLLLAIPVVLPAALTLHVDTTQLGAVNVDQLASAIQETLGLPPAPQA